VVGPKIGHGPSCRKRDIGAIVGGIVGGVAAIFAVTGVVIFVQRRRRRAGPKSVLSSQTDSQEAGSHAIVTPFDPNLNSPEGTRESRDTGDPPEQQPPVDENPDTEMVAPHRLSSSAPAVLPQPAVPVPVGLSDKEIARLRAQTFGSQQPQTHSTSNVPVSQPETGSSANAATESGEASSSYRDDTRRLHSVVESLRREMDRLRDLERLRAEGLVTEAPPSYTEGDR